MNEDNKRVNFPMDASTKSGSSNSNKTLVHFRRKTENLDWKKIASIDVEKVIQGSNVDVLDHLLPQVAYCRPESEFDSENPSSGLLKVFKLSQLMIEYLLQCQEILQGRSEQDHTKLTQIESQRLAYANEIQVLKEHLSAAKRELKRRKEIIASTQSEVIGDNKDEFDPCPYCSKKFLTSGYLYSHMLRRHQGLPIQPVFPSQSTYQGLAPKFIDNNYQKQHHHHHHGQYIEPPQSPRQRSSSLNQIVHTTESNNDENQQQQQQVQAQAQKTSVENVDKLVNLEIIGGLVEQYLQENGISTKNNEPKDVSVTLKHQNDHFTDKTVNGNVIRSSSLAAAAWSSPSKDFSDKSYYYDQEKVDPNETVIRISEQIKIQLDLQWRQLLDKIHESGLGDLNKSSLTSEPGEIESKSSTSSPAKSPQYKTESMTKLEQPDRRNMTTQVEKSTISTESATSPRIDHDHDQQQQLQLQQKQQQQLLEQRFQQQQHELESLKSNLQTRMENDMVTIESRLESQERYWRNKLRTVEEAYSEQLIRLREEFQKLIEKNYNNPSVESPPPSTPSQSPPSKGLVKSNNNSETTNRQMADNYSSSAAPDDSTNVVNYGSPPSAITNENSKQASSPPKPMMKLPETLSSEKWTQMDPEIKFSEPHSSLDHADSGKGTNFPEKTNTSVVKSSSPSVQHIMPRIVVQKRDVSHRTQRPENQMSSNSNPQLIVRPVVKPRKIGQSSVNMENDGGTKERHGSKKPVVENVIQVQTKQQQHHEYEEPDDILKLDEVTDYSNSGADSAVASSSGGESSDENGPTDNLERKTHHHHGRGHHHHRQGEPKSKIIVRMMTEEEAGIEQRNQIRENCEEELSYELKSLGVEPEETELEKKDLTKALRKLKQRRESLLTGTADEETKYNKLRERVQKEAKITLLTKSIQEKLDHSRYNSPKKGGTSPLVKILSAVKTSGNNWKRTVKSACKRPTKLEKERTTSLLTIRSPSKAAATGVTKKTKPGIFSRARWQRKKKKETSPPPPLFDYKAEHKGESSEDQSSEISGGSEPEIEKTIFITRTPTIKTRSGTSSKQQLSIHNAHKGVQGNQDDDDGEDAEGGSSTESESAMNAAERPHKSQSPHVTKNKFRVKNNIASKLRYREGKRKNAPTAPRPTAMLTMPVATVKERGVQQNNYAKFIASTGSSNNNPTKVEENVQQHQASKDQGLREQFTEKEKKSSARRSLETEFDQVTPPRKTSTPNTAAESKIKQQRRQIPGGTSGLEEDGSSSSWDDDYDHDEGVKKQHQSLEKSAAGEYVKLTPKLKDVTEKYQNNNKHQNQTQIVTHPNPRISMTMMTTSAVVNHNNNNQASHNAPRRLAMDSWDIDDDDDEDGGHVGSGNGNKNDKRPMSLVPQRWDTYESRQQQQPVYENTNGMKQRRPMTASTTTTTSAMKIPDSRNKPPLPSARDHGNLSPLNNSWDSDS